MRRADSRAAWTAGKTSVISMIAGLTRPDRGRIVLDGDISLQSPPNLNPDRTSMLLSSGINDFGGISPVTPDYINPRHPWPHLSRFADACERRGFTLAPRLPIYERYLQEAGWLDPGLRDVTEQQRTRLAAVTHPGDLAGQLPTPRPAARGRALPVAAS